MCQLGNYFNDFVFKLNSEGGQSKRENKKMNENVKFGERERVFYSFFKKNSFRLVALEITRWGQRLRQPLRSVFTETTLRLEPMTCWMLASGSSGQGAD